MKLKPSLFARWFGKGGSWRLEFDGERLVIATQQNHRNIFIHDVGDLNLARMGLWSELRILGNGEVLTFSGASKARASAFRKRVIGKVVSEGLQLLRDANPVGSKAIDAFLEQPIYIARRDVQRWKEDQARTNVVMARVLRLLDRPIFSQNARASDVPPFITRIWDLTSGPSQELRRRNDAFVETETKRLADFFAAVESKPLTEEQARAAVINEDRNLVVAAAGSGKTSVVVAKVGYALKTKACEASEVLALAFNKTAATELGERVLDRLGRTFPDVAGVQAQTFHKFGLQTIAQAEGKKPSLAPWAGEAGDAGQVIQELAAELSRSDVGFATRWLLFRALAAQPHRSIARFETRSHYEDYLEQVGDSEGGRRGIRTLNGELVKSMEEVAIANWLFLKGVPYVYEKSYEYDTADREHRQYHPDFYYPDIDLYHEHFALDENGRAPSFFSEDYEAGVEWKRALHRAKATNLIETTSADFRDGSALAKLEKSLVERGQTLKPRSVDEVEERLGELRIPKFEALLKTVISLAKTNGIEPVALEQLARNQRDPFRAVLFADVVRPLFEAYEKRLQALGCIDFEDMIWRAVGHVRGGRQIHPFKLILVDEFQDISRSRSELVKAMLEQNADCKLFAVGDDWQAIYRFAGADQSIMTDFAAEYGVTATSFLTTTFRCNQGIADASSNFIQRNPAQIKKHVKSLTDRRASTIHVLEYARDDQVETLLSEELRVLADRAPSRGRKATVRLLARFNFLRPGALAAWQKQYADAIDIQFLSLHRSKGLEADYVFILGCNSGAYGIPSGLESDPLLNMVLPHPEDFDHAEERRLFYVGLTRARHRCYLLTRSGSISPFIREILGEGEAITYRVGYPRPAPVNAEPCRECSSGVVREIAAYDGANIACSNFPRCR